ncbi:MAG: hypothetical protein ACOX0Z_00755 [Candidatus Nanosyncoccaceae bacterium]|jgi:CBS domain containing-hemolysin-like protein
MWYVLLVLLVVVIVVLSAWGGLKTDYSAWQLKQKQEQIKSNRAKLDLDRLTSKPTLLSWQLIGLITLYVSLFFVSQKAMGDGKAWLVILISLILVNIVAKIKPIQRLAQAIYLRIEKHLLRAERFLRRVANLTNLSSLKQLDGGSRDRVDSLDELLFLVENSPAAIDDSQRRLIRSVLEFDDITVDEIMTSFDEVMSLAANDLIGPLMLDDLHRTGYEYFPVLNRADEVVGILNLADLVSLDNKTSQTAQELCDNEVVMLRCGDSLMGALQQLLTEQALVAVVEKRGKPVGVVRLNSIIASLIGDKM